MEVLAIFGRPAFGYIVVACLGAFVPLISSVCIVFCTLVAIRAVVPIGVALLAVSCLGSNGVIYLLGVGVALCSDFYLGSVATTLALTSFVSFPTDFGAGGSLCLVFFEVVIESGNYFCVVVSASGACKGSNALFRASGGCGYFVGVFVVAFAANRCFACVTNVIVVFVLVTGCGFFFVVGVVATRAFFVSVPTDVGAGGSLCINVYENVTCSNGFLTFGIIANRTFLVGGVTVVGAGCIFCINVYELVTERTNCCGFSRNLFGTNGTVNDGIIATFVFAIRSYVVFDNCFAFGVTGCLESGGNSRGFNFTNSAIDYSVVAAVNKTSSSFSVFFNCSASGVTGCLESGGNSRDFILTNSAIDYSVVAAVNKTSGSFSVFFNCSAGGVSHNGNYFRIGVTARASEGFNTCFGARRILCYFACVLVSGFFALQAARAFFPVLFAVGVDPIAKGVRGSFTGQSGESSFYFGFGKVFLASRAIVVSCYAGRESGLVVNCFRCRNQFTVFVTCEDCFLLYKNLITNRADFTVGKTVLSAGCGSAFNELFGVIFGLGNYKRSEFCLVFAKVFAASGAGVVTESSFVLAGCGNFFNPFAVVVARGFDYFAFFNGVSAVGANQVASISGSGAVGVRFALKCGVGVLALGFFASSAFCKFVEGKGLICNVTSRIGVTTNIGIGCIDANITARCYIYEIFGGRINLKCFIVSSTYTNTIVSVVAIEPFFGGSVNVDG